jgi:peptide/nickel transport system permease protein
MTAYIVRRLIQAVIVLIIVTMFIFLLMRILPGDPIYMLLTPDQLANITQEEIDNIRHEAGLDKPIIVQYVDWLWGVAHGDLGKSLIEQTSVNAQIARKAPVTFNLSILSFLVSLILGIPAGVICAIRRSKWIDTVLTILANIGITIPSFWAGIILIYFFSLQLHWLPAQGYTSPFTDIVLNIRQCILPVACLSVFPIAAVVRQTRSSMLEVMRQDYMRTAWSKGLRERVVVMKHALKNGIIPVVTLSGMQLSHILGGSVLIETVFNIPGMGRLMVTATFSRDYTIVQGFVLLTAVTVLLVNIIIDISYVWLDPRIRYS